MTEKTQDERVSARALFAQGATIEQVAAAVGRSVKTVYRWRAADARAGRPWEALRNERRRKDSHAVLVILEGRFAHLVERNDLEDGAYADAVNKLAAVVDRMRIRLGDISLTLGVLEAFAGWCVEHLTEQEMPPIRGAVNAYLDQLKSGG